MYPTFTEEQSISDAADTQPNTFSIEINNILNQFQFPIFSSPWQATVQHQIPNVHIYPPPGHSVTTLPSPPSFSHQFLGNPYNDISSILTSPDSSEHLSMAMSPDYSMSYRRHSMLELHQIHLGATQMQDEVPQPDNMAYLGIPNVSGQQYSAVTVTPSLHGSSPSTTVETVGPDMFAVPSPQSIQSPQIGLRVQEQCNSETNASTHRALLGKMLSLAESQSPHASWAPNAAAALTHCSGVNPLPQYACTMDMSQSNVLASTLMKTPAPDDQLDTACVGAPEALPNPTCGARRRSRGSLRSVQSASMVFPPEAQRALQEVLLRIQNHPYPDSATIRQLKDEYELSTKQIRNWFALRRFRHMYWTEHEGIRKWHFRRNAM
ncbi:hypothetical protein H4S00_002506 [Coemansia sp. D1744]|nr:hypothetical protein H4S00_002506 [Coemansia sp. D1744]